MTFSFTMSNNQQRRAIKTGKQIDALLLSVPKGKLPTIIPNAISTISSHMQICLWSLTWRRLRRFLVLLAKSWIWLCFEQRLESDQFPDSLRIAFGIERSISVEGSRSLFGHFWTEAILWAPEKGPKLTHIQPLVSSYLLNRFWKFATCNSQLLSKCISSNWFDDN